MKKTMSLLLALIMVLALAVPVFASGSVSVGAEILAPTTTVTMPTGVVLGLNPYGMTYSGSNPFLKSLKDSQDQILSVAAVIENKSDTKLAVSATATATIASADATNAAVALVTSDTFADTVVDKQICLKMQLGETDKDGGWTGTEPTAAVFPASSASFASPVVYYGVGSDNAVITTDTPNSGTMKAVEIAATDGKTPNYIGFKFSGAMNDHPTAAWASGDKVTVSVAFTFKPMKNDAAS